MEISLSPNDFYCGGRETEEVESMSEGGEVERGVVEAGEQEFA